MHIQNALWYSFYILVKEVARVALLNQLQETWVLCVTWLSWNYISQNPPSLDDSDCLEEEFRWWKWCSGSCSLNVVIVRCGDSHRDVAKALPVLALISSVSCSSFYPLPLLTKHGLRPTSRGLTAGPQRQQPGWSELPCPPGLLFSPLPVVGLAGFSDCVVTSLISTHPPPTPVPSFLQLLPQL